MVKSIEQRVTDLEEIIADLPGILNVRFAQAKAERDEIKAQVSALAVNVSALSVTVNEMKYELRVLPRVIAQMITERDSKV